MRFGMVSIHTSVRKSRLAGFKLNWESWISGVVSRNRGPLVVGDEATLLPWLAPFQPSLRQLHCIYAGRLSYIAYTAGNSIFYVPTSYNWGQCGGFLFVPLEWCDLWSTGVIINFPVVCASSLRMSDHPQCIGSTCNLLQSRATVLVG